MEPILLEHMTIEIVCNDLHDFWTKSGAVISKNVFYKSRPPGGAITGRSGKFGAEVHLWYPESVCAKFGIDRVNGCRD